MCSRPRGFDAAHPFAGETHMDIVVGLVAIGLLIYLFLALIRPEWF
jgi:K+-transporting ATPase KdpF subunit